MLISPERSANELKQQKDNEVIQLKRLLQEQEEIVEEFQRKGSKDEKQIQKLTEKYRAAILREQQLRSSIDNMENDRRY